MKQKLKTIIEELQNASKMHLRQSKELASHAKDMDKGSPANQNYNEVNVQDLQDMGKVKKNKKGKYVVNENPTTVNDTLYIPKKFKSYTGKKPKVGEMIDESDYENLSSQANNPINRNKPKVTPVKKPLTAKEKKRLHAVASVTDKAIREQDYPGQVGAIITVPKKK